MKYEIIGGTHSFELIYVEDEKYMQLGIDLREPTISLGEDVLSNWEAPFDKMTIAKKDKARILKNIYKYLCKYYSSDKIIFSEGS